MQKTSQSPVNTVTSGMQITLKRNASSATAELLFHFLRYEVPLDDIILFHAYLYRSFPDDMYDVYL